MQPRRVISIRTVIATSLRSPGCPAVFSRLMYSINLAPRLFASVVCLEQVAPGEFQRHTLEENSTVHATLEMADFDADGDLDFAVGFHSLSRLDQAPHWVSVWWNQGAQVPNE